MIKKNHLENIYLCISWDDAKTRLIFSAFNTQKGANAEKKSLLTKNQKRKVSWTVVSKLPVQ